MVAAVKVIPNGANVIPRMAQADVRISSGSRHCERM